MSVKLDAVAHRKSADYRMRRLEKTIMLLNTIVNKVFQNEELEVIYNKHIQEIRADLTMENNDAI